MAPRRTASAFLAALRASSVSGVPGNFSVLVASMEAYGVISTMEPGVVVEQTHATKELLLKVELDVRSLFLDNSQDLSQ